MDTGIVLQGLNGILAPVALWASFIFGRYMYNNWHLGYWELRAAIAMMAIALFEAILRFPIFVLRTLANAGFDTHSSVNQWYIIGGCGVLIGFLCVIRVFSPYKWGVWSWISPLFIALSITTASFVYVFWR